MVSVGLERRLGRGGSKGQRGASPSRVAGLAASLRFPRGFSRNTSSDVMNLGLPRIILYLALVFIVAGIVLHGIAWSEFQRIWDHLSARPSGSLALRFFLQPAMSTIFAIRDGIKDARTGRSPYFWTVLSNPDKRRARLREGAA